MQPYLFDLKQPQFTIISSNDLQELSQHFTSQILTDPLGNPFAQELVVVQTEGMKRWLSLELAKDNGICAQLNFLFPNSLISTLNKKLNIEKPAQSAYHFQYFHWAIFTFLKEDFLKRTEAKILADYVAGNDLKLYQLSRRIADLFDQYCIYRPELILAWEAGKRLFPDSADETWQQSLWQALGERFGKEHRLWERSALLNYLHKTPAKAIKAHIGRIWVFGITSLAPYHLDILVQLAQKIAINFYVFAPTPYYFGDIVSERTELYLKKQARKKGVNPQDLFMERGHKLLAAMGQAGRTFQSQLFDYEAIQQQDLFKEPQPQNLLTQLQADIFNMHDRGFLPASNEADAKVAVSKNDDSLTIISAYSALREVEILFEHCLAFLDKNPAATAADILVMMPDIEIYTPYIEAVFGAQSEAKKIPYAIADRAVSNESAIADTFLDILELVNQRFEVEHVLNILNSPAIFRQYALTETDLEQIHFWIKDTQIRWGLSGKDKAKLGLPEDNANTWKTGLKRLLIAFASESEQAVLGVYPYTSFNYSQQNTLAQLVEFIADLAELCEYCAAARTINEWTSIFDKALKQFFYVDNNTEREIGYVRSLLALLTEATVKINSDPLINFKAMQAYLNDYLAHQSMGFGFLTGGITFCSLIPMRSIPFKMIAILGLNDAVFPRQNTKLSFDLLAYAPKATDRSVRELDKYLFFETLLAAREKFYISYVGLSQIENAVLQPSVLVTELLDTIYQGFYLPGTENQTPEQQSRALQKHLVAIHPLQPFSSKYFINQNPQLFSYSQENFIAAKACEERTPTSLPVKLPEIKTEAQELLISHTDLLTFLVNPAKYFMQKKLGIVFPELSETTASSERFELDPLSDYTLNQWLFTKTLTEAPSLDDTYEELSALGSLPHGALGKEFLKGSFEAVKRFKTKYDSLYLQPGQTNPVIYDKAFKIGDHSIRLTGNLNLAATDKLLLYRVVKEPKPKDFLTVWLNLLLANLAQIGSDVGLQIVSAAHFICLDDKKDFTLNLPENWQEVLANLLNLYIYGQTTLLPLPLSFGAEYIQALLGKKTPEAALVTAKAKWQEQHNFENQDPYFKYALAITGWLEPESVLQEQLLGQLKQIWEPLLMSRKKFNAGELSL